MDISSVDKNLMLADIPKGLDVELHPITEPAFSLHGVMATPDGYARLPHSYSGKINYGVTAVYRNTAGGRIRFYTDSPFVVVCATSREVVKMAHMTRVGCSGFDLYVDGVTYGAFVSEWKPDGDTNRFTAIRKIGHAGDVTVYMPLYNNVDEVFIGIARGATLTPARGGYLDIPPVVYYGSSVTQGGCATRSGMSYQAILTRRLGVDHVNLGFSGSARGESALAEYIASLDMSAFVFDYDYNAPTPEHLLATHKPFFDIIRRAKPDLPIILMTRPKHSLNAEDVECEKIVKQTYDAALGDGDKNVYLVLGTELMRDAGVDGTVDGCHPTDLGFWSMANALEPVLKAALGI